MGGPGGEILYIETDGKFFKHRLWGKCKTSIVVVPLLNIEFHIPDVYEGSRAKLGNAQWDLPRMFNYGTAKTHQELTEIIDDLYFQLEDDEEVKNIRLIIIDSLSTVYRAMMTDFGKMVRLQNRFMLQLVSLVTKYDLLVS